MTSWAQSTQRPPRGIRTPRIRTGVAALPCPPRCPALPAALGAMGDRDKHEAKDAAVAIRADPLRCPALPAGRRSARTATKQCAHLPDAGSAHPERTSFFVPSPTRGHCSAGEQLLHDVCGKLDQMPFLCDAGRCCRLAAQPAARRVWRLVYACPTCARCPFAARRSSYRLGEACAHTCGAEKHARTRSAAQTPSQLCCPTQPVCRSGLACPVGPGASSLRGAGLG